MAAQMRARSSSKRVGVTQMARRMAATPTMASGTNTPITSRTAGERQFLAQGSLQRRASALHLHYDTRQKCAAARLQASTQFVKCALECSADSHLLFDLFCKCALLSTKVLNAVSLWRVCLMMPHSFMVMQLAHASCMTIKLCGCLQVNRLLPPVTIAPLVACSELPSSRLYRHGSNAVLESGVWTLWLEPHAGHSARSGSERM